LIKASLTILLYILGFITTIKLLLKAALKMRHLKPFSPLCDTLPQEALKAVGEVLARILKFILNQFPQEICLRVALGCAKVAV
jgi:hypothetical protein